MRDMIREDGVVRGDGGAHLFELGSGGRRRKISELEFELGLVVRVRAFWWRSSAGARGFI